MPSFFERAADLRANYEACVGPSRSSTDKRFLWDYWHVPGQYTYIRTPAINVIPPSLLAEFTTVLRDWGSSALGCGRVTVPWLSYYIEGCRQELHSDVVQGMWSYVYSLTPWEDRRFTGGETLLGGEHLLDYWANFDPAASQETRHLLDRIPATFDQLCVFDSRLPHGVATIEGTRDPLQARVALHGWFRDPEPAVQGALDLERVAGALGDVRRRWRAERARLGPFHGQATWRVGIDADGSVERVVYVVDNLVRVRPSASDPTGLVEFGSKMLHDARFPAADGASDLLLPLE